MHRCFQANLSCPVDSFPLFPRIKAIMLTLAALFPCDTPPAAVPDLPRNGGKYYTTTGINNIRPGSGSPSNALISRIASTVE